jgi:hypothetical protein
MRTRATITALLTAALLTACSTDSSHDTKPTPTTAPASRTASPSHAELIQRCADAIQAGRDEGDGAEECTSLSLDDYYEALRKANQAGRKSFSGQ